MKSSVTDQGSGNHPRHRTFRLVWSAFTVVMLATSMHAAGQPGLPVDLVITVDNNVPYVSPGQNVTYEIAVNNFGPNDTEEAAVQDTFPPELINVTWMASTTAGASSLSGSGTGDLSDTVNIPVGGRVVYTVSALVDPFSTGTVTNTATVTAPTGMTESFPANNTATDEDAIEFQEIARVQPFYGNGWPSPNVFAPPGDIPPDNGTAAFNGHVGDFRAPDDPNSNQPRFVLKTSSLGQPLAQYISGAVDIDLILRDAINDLFYVQGNSSEQNNSAAFRFINTLFTNDLGPGVVEEIRRRLTDTLAFDDADDERALSVADEIKPLLQAFPHDRSLRNLLLDIYYYRTLGRQLVAKQKVVEAYQLNFSQVLSSDVSFGTPINKEIEAFQEAADSLRDVLNPYVDLLTDDLGVDIATQVDPSYTGNLPFGFYLFREEVPNRSVYAPTFVEYLPETGEVSGDPTQVVDDTRQAPLLYATPTSFHVDADGMPEGSTVNQVSFTIENLGAGTDGAGDLHWEATVKNPFDFQGESDEMLEIYDADSGIWGTRLASAEPIEPPTLGIPATVTVRISKNLSALRRSGTIEVRDVSGKPDALTYSVIIVQSGDLQPQLIVEPKELYYTSGPFFPVTEPLLQVHSVHVRKEGIGDLNWKATVIPEGLPPGTSILVSKRQSSSSGESVPAQEVTATNNALLSVYLYGTFEQPGAYNIVGIDDLAGIAERQVITLYVGPQVAKTASLPLLSAYPEVIAVSSGDAVDDIFVRDAEGLGTVTASTTNSWLTVRAIDEGGFIPLEIAENTSPEVRTGYVTIRAESTGNQSSVVTVVQDGAAGAGLVVNPAQRYVGHGANASASGSGFEVIRVGSDDIAWTSRVSQGGHWLNIVSGESGTNDGEILFSYDENTSLHGRTGEIVIVSPEAIEGQNLFAVQIFQRGTEDTQVLHGGFKDFILLFDVMRDDAQVNKELAKRFALRRLPGDVDKAYSLIGETISKHTVAVNDISGIIPDWRERVAQSSELVATYSGWLQAIEELATVKDFLDGDSNILGFRENFLFLVQEFQGQDPSIFDSFDKLLRYMFDDENNTAVPTSPLGLAFSRYEQARLEYENFVETQDSLAEEYRTQNLDHRKWMYDVIGTDPGNDVDHPDNAEAYYNPSASFGCEIWQIDRSIDRALEQLNLNKAELQKIVDQIRTELWRRAQEQQINAAIADVHINYGLGLAAIEVAIGAINAVQVVADNIADGVSDAAGIETPLKAGPIAWARGVNAVVQAAAEIAKGVAEGGKALLAASENADVRQLEDQILGANSEALVKNLYGEANLVAMKSADLALGLAQEIGSRQANIDEWHYREDRMRENNAALLGRSFANPVHRLRLRRSMLEAESTFKVAQRWVFFTIRALEYKWNTPFVYSSPTGDWSLDSVFRARTARDLVFLVGGLRDYDGLLQGSARGDDRFDWFTFKQDFYGLNPVFAGNGVEERVYTHPVTGYGATATEVFRARLEEVYDPETGVIEIPFSTFKDNGLTFFRGPRRDADNPEIVLSRGHYLDKIVWMKVNLTGDFSESPIDRVSGILTYSGGSYVRNARVGVLDPADPTRIIGEFSVWPTKFWFFDSGQPLADPPIAAAWRSSDEQHTEIALNLTDLSRYEVPGTVSEIDVFRERSVASDGWVLRIFTQNAGVPAISVDQIDDIEILFYHVSKERPALKEDESAGRD